MPDFSARNFDNLETFFDSETGDGSSGSPLVPRSALRFSRNGSLSSIVLDTSTPANNRALPTVLLSGDASAIISPATSGNQTTTITRLGTNGDAASKTGSEAAQLRLIGDVLDGTTSRTVTQASGVKTVSATGTPEALVGTTTLVKSVFLQAGRSRANNTSTVWLGTSSTNDAQPIELTPGSAIVLSAPPGGVVDLNGIFIDVTTANDGVRYWSLT